MKPWLRTTLFIVGGVLIVVAAAYYWLIMESHAPSSTAYSLNVAEIRRLADSMPGDKVSAVEVERVVGKLRRQHEIGVRGLIAIQAYRR